ncbi:hypothetical protein HMPREF1580_00619, partial [Gardnerella vaginalis JCP8070]
VHITNMVQNAEFFPGFVRNLGGIWYKVRKYRSRRLAAEFRKAGNKKGPEQSLQAFVCWFIVL